MTPEYALALTKQHLVTSKDYISVKKVGVLQREFPTMYTELMSYMSLVYPTLTITQSYRLMKAGIHQPYRCMNQNCNNIINNDNRASVNRHLFAEYCSRDCANTADDRINSIRSTKVERYGGNGFEVDSHCESAYSTMIRLYGVKYYVTHKDFTDKVRRTSTKKYGTEHPFQSDVVQQNYTNVMLAKYGIANPWESCSPFRDKAEDTMIELYGSKNIMTTEYMRSLRESDGTWVKQEDKEPFRIYHDLVWKFTAMNEHLVKNIDLRGRLDINPNAYHLDHQFSINAGFYNMVDPEVIGSVHNLAMIPARDNCGKGSKCSISLEHLLNLHRQCW